MTSVTDLREALDIIIGVDTHVHTHAAAAVDTATGAVIGEITVEATKDGYTRLIEFANEHATLRAWAIEGTGSYGAGLTRVLIGRNEAIFELDRPVRTQRRNGAKSDPLDAIRAAREALARTRLSSPRRGSDHAQDRQALAVLLTARRSAVDAAGDARRQLFSLVVTAPEALRKYFRDIPAKAIPNVASQLRLQASWDVETSTTARILRTVARRIKTLTVEAADHEKAILAIVRNWRSDLLDQPGIGPIIAATILCAWSYPGRIHSEAAFAMLAGVAPIPANSGQVTTRYRLNRHGDRQLNRALHTITITRISHDQRTKTYIERRTAEGKTPREIERCLKRYIARDLYRLLEAGQRPT